MLDVFPFAQGFIDLCVFHDGETRIRAVGKEGQYMDNINDIV